MSLFRGPSKENEKKKQVDARKGGEGERRNRDGENEREATTRMFVQSLSRCPFCLV